MSFITGILLGAWAMFCVLFLSQRRANPLSAIGRARLRWYRARDSRAVHYINAGMRPDDAVELATQELRTEAQEAMRGLP